MVNFRGPKSEWDKMDKKDFHKRPHSYGEENGIVIVEELPFETKSKMWQEIETRAKDLKKNKINSNPFPKTIFDKDE